MPIVELSNGQQLEFPDSMSNDQIKAVIQKKFPVNKSNQEQKSTGLLEQAGSAAQKYINEPVEDILRQANEASSGFLQGTANIVPGVYNLGAKAVNLIPGVDVEEMKGLHFAPHTPSAIAGEVGSFFGPGMLGKIPEISSIPNRISQIPQIAEAIKKASSVLSKAPKSIQNMLSGSKDIASNALLGAVMTPEDQGIGALLGAGGAGAGKLMGMENQLSSAVGRTALGGGLGYAYGGMPGAEAGAGIAALGPKALKIAGVGGGKPGIEALQGLRYEDILPSVEAGERLGTPLRPSEASSNPFVAGNEGRYARTSNAAAENVKLGMERTKQEKSAINSLLDTIYDKSVTSKNNIKSLYKQAYGWNLKPEILNQLKSDPIIENAINEVKTDRAWQRKLEGTPENNYAYLDKVRKSISDQEHKLKRSGEIGKANEYTQARQQLVKVMDESVPVYKQARSEAERSITRSKMEKKLKKSEVTGSEFFKKIIENEDTYNGFVKSLRNVPEAQKKLSDMKQAWHSLVNLEKPNSAAYQSSKGIDQSRGKLDEIVKLWDEATGSKRNLEAIKYIRSDKWIKDLKELNEVKDKSRKQEILSGFLGKLFPSGYSAVKGIEQ